MFSCTLADPKYLYLDQLIGTDCGCIRPRQPKCGTQTRGFACAPGMFLFFRLLPVFHIKYFSACMGVPRPAEGWGTQHGDPGDSFLSARLSQGAFCL